METIEMNDEFLLFFKFVSVQLLPSFQFMNISRNRTERLVRKMCWVHVQPLSLLFVITYIGRILIEIDDCT